MRYLETLALYRKIAEGLVSRGVFLLHGSAVAVDGEVYIFIAPSGTGKSTHTALWRRLLIPRGHEVVMVNDDKPLIHIGENGVTVYGTPYNGKHRLGSNISIPLKAICILTRDTDNHIEPVTREQAYPILLQQTYRPKDRLKTIKTLTLINKLADQVKLYLLGCNMDISAAKISFEGMSNE